MRYAAVGSVHPEDFNFRRAARQCKRAYEQAAKGGGSQSG